MKKLIHLLVSTKPMRVFNILLLHYNNDWLINGVWSWFSQEFVGYDILVDNSVSLCVSERQACIQGISQNFHLQGKTCCTSLFYNVDASTMEKHIELDWLMTTIFVPQQKWKEKRKIIFSLFSISLGKMECCVFPCLLVQSSISMVLYLHINKDTIVVKWLKMVVVWIFLSMQIEHCYAIILPLSTISNRRKITN